MQRASTDPDRDSTCNRIEREEEIDMAKMALWVKDTNPDQTFLIALLMRVCKEQPNQVPPEFQRFGQGDHSQELTYRISPNPAKGGVTVEFTLSPK